MIWLGRTHQGDCRVLMRRMIRAGVRVNCVVTSPPYWGLRDYGVAGAFGLERTWMRHVARMRGVFRLVRELMADDGVLWLNYGDSYYTPRPNGSVGYNSTINGKRNQEEFRRASRMKKRMPVTDGPNRRRQRLLKPKDMVGMPWRIAFALHADGWYLRSDIIWHKPNPMPESTRDRPTKSHEYVFLLAKSELYHYDAEAIAEPVTGEAHLRRRAGGKPVHPAGWANGAGKLHSPKAHARTKGKGTKFGHDTVPKYNDSFNESVQDLVDNRNVRTVWTLPTQPFGEAHFATFPEALVARCILAGSRPGDVIFDPFMGAGTVAKVATDLGRQFIGCELNPEYIQLAEERRTTIGMPI